MFSRMRKYEIREGSVAAYTILLMFGLFFGPGLVALAIF